ncbi:presenilin-associated rhomboid-like protein, mitochondrial [Petromyzon marinus]|uniref:rhomboid protease n=1 Tax=Petromyzon marinus TaxID=7757 RepID=A0AAJ7WY05_PETMA|nr:presenilins-associated rhomboid-like protein, mitochondrial [Petromyzon marinus]
MAAVLRGACVACPSLSRCLVPWQTTCRGFRRVAKDGSLVPPPARNGLLRPAESIPGGGRGSAVSLVRPLFFTIGFSGCAFATASIVQYEVVKHRVNNYLSDARGAWMERTRPKKSGDIRKQINQWWNSLSEGGRTVAGIIAINVLVFGMWRVPALQSSMMRFFMSNPAAKAPCLPMILSCFSHYSPMHLAANMYVLWSFSHSAVSMFGREQFLAFYTSAGVTSSFASYVFKTVTGKFTPSLGASGAIMAVLAAVCTQFPDSKLAIIFLPMIPFTASSALMGIMALDTTGLILGWKLFDHAAHLGGALFGILYAWRGNEVIWLNREPLLRIWHNIRSRGGGS